MDHPDKEAKESIRPLENLAVAAVRWASGPWATELILAFLALWLIAGPFFHFSREWQDVMVMTSATVTFAMVFLLVRAQTKDTLTIQMKLNEVIGALQGANNQLINIENLSETAILKLSKRYEAVSEKLSNAEEISVESIIAHEIAEEEKKEAEVEKKGAG